MCYKIFLSLIVSCFITFNISAQQFNIFGAVETCQNCESYFPSITFQGPIEFNVNVTGPIPNVETCHTLIPNYENGTFSVCFSCYGTYKLDATYYGQNGQIYRDSLVVFYRPSFPILITPKDSISCFRTNQSKCEKVCAGSTHVYKIINPDGGFPITVDVSGATSYFHNVNTSELTVTWGDEGMGNIRATGLAGQNCFNDGSLCIDIVKNIDADFIIPGTNFCVGESIVFEPSSLDGYTYEWDFGNGTTSTDIKPIVEYDAPGTYQISLSVSNECGCIGNIVKEIIIKDNYLPRIDCKSTICENTTSTYTTDADCGVFYWKVLGDGKIKSGGGQSDKSITIDWGKGPLGIVELEVSGCNFDLCPKKAVYNIPIISEDAKIVGETKACKGAKEIYAIQKYGATDYQWVVTGGNITAGQGSNSVIVEWSSLEEGTVKVMYNNCYLKCGGSDELTVFLKTKYTLKLDNDQVCSGSSIFATAYNNNNIPSIIEKWEVKDNNNNLLATETNKANISYLVPVGISKILITTTSQTYCDAVQQIKATVLPKSSVPTGIIGETAICKGNDYLYEADSNLPNATFTWTVEDGNISKTLYGDRVLVNWSTDGPYRLSLQQLDVSGLYCLSPAIQIAPQKISSVAITGVDQSCQYDEYTAEATYYESLTYEWSVIPADAATIIRSENSTITLKWSATGTHTLVLKTCAGTFQKSVNVNELPQPIVDHPLAICEGTTFKVLTTTSFTSYKWRTTQGNSISQSATPFLYPGTFICEVKNDKGCIGNSSFTIVELPKPNIRLSTPDDNVVCLSDPTPNFPKLYALDAQDGYKYNWVRNYVDLGVFTSTYTPTDVGIYFVGVEDAFGCTNSSDGLDIIDRCDPINPPPADTIGLCNSTTGSVGFNFANVDCNSFLFTSTAASIIPNSHVWNFDDYKSNDNYSNFANPVHDFSNAGYFKVTHIVSVEDSNNPGGECPKFIRKIIEVPIKAEFDFTNACQNEVVTFYDRSTFIPLKDITSWSWDFGDPASGADNISSIPDPTHIFALAGTYNVKLTISNGLCTDEITKTITLHPQPTYDIVALDALCEKETTTFKLDPIDNTLASEWTFDDPTSGANNTQISTSANHNFATPGTYLITSSVTTLYGCKAILSKNIDIKTNTLTGTSNSSLGNTFCEGGTATLTAPSGGQKWIWSDKSSSEQISTQVSGIYNVTVTNGDGCQYSPDPLLINVLPAPKSSITSEVTLDELTIQYFGEKVAFCQGSDFSISVPNSSDLSYQWQNGSTTNSLSFTESGGNQLVSNVYNFGVKLKNTLTGCTNDIGPVEVTVNGLPANIQISSNTAGLLCEGINHNFTVVNPLSTLKYTWNIGKKTPSITTSLAGKYFVQGVDINGCKGLSNVLNIESGPDVSLVPNGCFERCAPDTLCFPSISDVTKYAWKKNGVVIPDNQGGNTPYIVLIESGDYTLELTGTNGCKNVSEPLSLTLNQAIGNIQIRTFSDVNANNVIDGGDTLLTNVDLTVGGYSLVSSDIVTNLAVPYGQYIVSFNPANIPDGAKAIIDGLEAKIKTCNDSVYIDLLLGFDCFAKSTTENYRACFGESFELLGQFYSSDTTIIVKKPNNQGCIDTTKHVLSFTEKIEFASDATKSCPGKNDGNIIVFNINASNYTYFLNGAQTNLVNGSFTNLEAGIYKIKIRDNYGCIRNENVEIQDKEAVKFELITNDVSCKDGFSILKVNLQNYLANEVDIVWSNGKSGTENKVTAGGNYSVDISNGCNNVIEPFSIKGPESTKLYKKYIVCSGNKLDLLEKTFTSDTILYRIAQNALGCIDSTIYDLRFSQKFDFTLDVNGTCPGKNDGTIDIDMKSPGVFTYFLNDIKYDLLTQPINTLNPGEYVLKIKDNIGCEQKVDIDIKEKEAVKYTVLKEDITCFKGYASIQIDLKNYTADDVEISWSNGKKGINNQVTTQGNISLTISNGCDVVTESLNIISSDREPAFLLPNIMNPYHSFSGTVFDIEKTDFKDAVIKGFNVYDISGRRLHTSKTLEWNTYGNELPDGLYFYTVEAEVNVCGNIKTIKKTGKFGLFR